MSQVSPTPWEEQVRAMILAFTHLTPCRCLGTEAEFTKTRVEVRRLIREFTCDNPDTPRSSPARVKRIERREYTYSASGSMTKGITRNNPFAAPGRLPFSTYAEDVSVDAVTLGLFFTVIDEAGEGWSNLNQNQLALFQSSAERQRFRCLTRGEIPDVETCLDPFLTLLMLHGSHHRLPTANELDDLRNFALETFVVVSDPLEAVVEISSAARLMVGALFRSEVGVEPEVSGGRYRLSVPEFVLALGYFLGDHAPGTPGVHLYDQVYSTGPEGHFPEIVEAGRREESTPGMNGALYARGENAGYPTIEALIGLYAATDNRERPDLVAEYSSEKVRRRGQYGLSAKLRRFFREWLGYEPARTIFKDTPEATSRFDNDTIPSRSLDMSYRNQQQGFDGDESTMVQQLDDLIARVVFETHADPNRDVLGELLTTRQAFVPSSFPFNCRRNRACCEEMNQARGGNNQLDCLRLENGHNPRTDEAHRMYDLDGPIPDEENNPDARWTNLEDRAGVLTHPAWLAAHGGNFEDDPSAIYRGKWIRENLLCGIISEIPITVQAVLDERGVHPDARTRIEAATGPDAPDSQCQGCHVLMNPLGFPFEMYNHAGFLRDPQDPRSPDTSTSTNEHVLPGDLNQADVQFESAIDMMETFARSEHVRRCFLRQTFRYFMSRNETLADACVLAKMESTYLESNGSLISVLQSLATDDAFLYRHDEMMEGQ
jgi:hypothetical protein